MPKIITGGSLVALLQESGFEPRSYSGRGMSGRECVGVACGRDVDVSEWDIAWSLASTVAEMDENIRIPEPSHDQLGLGTILYWPYVEWPKEEVEA